MATGNTLVAVGSLTSRLSLATNGNVLLGAYLWTISEAWYKGSEAVLVDSSSERHHS